MSRNRLSVKKLSDFVAFLEADGWVSEQTKSCWEAARLRREKKITIIWQRLANRSGEPLQHLTLDRIGEVLFDIWIKEREA